MLTKSCLICNKEFRVLSQRRLQVAKFCSQVCYGLSERGRIPKTAYKKGQHPSPKTEFKKGKLHPYYGKSSPALGKKWGLSGRGRSVRYELMNRPEHRKWRKAVFERDNYTCQICYVRGGKLHADHIKPFYLYPELVFSLENGRTLCILCHRKTPTFGRPKSSKKNSQLSY